MSEEFSVPGEVVALVMRLFVGKRGAEVASFFMQEVIPIAVDCVRHIKEEMAEGEDKRHAAVSALAMVVDEHMDSIPEWEDLSEEQRDRILNGLVELSYFLIKVSEDASWSKRLSNALRIRQRVSSFLAANKSKRDEK